jgi:hypothetical protein
VHIEGLRGASGPGFKRDLRKEPKNVGVVGGRTMFLGFAKSDEGACIRNYGKNVQPTFLNAAKREVVPSR